MEDCQISCLSYLIRLVPLESTWPVPADGNAIKQPQRENQSLESWQHRILRKRFNLWSEARAKDKYFLRWTYLKPDTNALNRPNPRSEAEYGHTWKFSHSRVSKNKFRPIQRRSGRKKLSPSNRRRKNYNFDNFITDDSQDSAGNSKDKLAPPFRDLRLAKPWGKRMVSAWKTNAGRKKGWRMYPYNKSKRKNDSHGFGSQSKHPPVHKGGLVEVINVVMPLAALRQIGKPLKPRVSSRATCQIQDRTNKMPAADIKSLQNCSELNYIAG